MKSVVPNIRRKVCQVFSRNTNFLPNIIKRDIIVLIVTLAKFKGRKSRLAEDLISKSMPEVKSELRVLVNPTGTVFSPSLFSLQADSLLIVANSIHSVLQDPPL
jgi:hypothetical protein